MKCHYEVLGVERDTDGADIKKAYRKLALQIHPDKHPEDVDKYTQMFHKVQAAYEVLVDPQERAWYDKHRESILKGGEDYVDNEVELMHYFDPSIYSGFNDGPEGFYTVFSEAFKRVSEEDEPYLEGDDVDDYVIPEFGESTSDYDSVVKAFYAHWLGYCTKKSYAWKEKYDLRQAPNRPTQRLMEKENKKIKDACKRKRNEEVRALVSYVRKRDKRVQAYRKLLEEKQQKQKEELERRIEEDKRNKKKILEDYQEQEWMTVDDTMLDSIDSHFDDRFGKTRYDSDASESSVEEEFYCIACDKKFKSEKALSNHEKSKKHKENVQLIKMEMSSELNDDIENDLHVDKLNVGNDDLPNDEEIEQATPLHRVSSLNLPENIIRLNVTEKTIEQISEQSDDSDVLLMKNIRQSGENDNGIDRNNGVNNKDANENSKSGKSNDENDKIVDKDDNSNDDNNESNNNNDKTNKNKDKTNDNNDSDIEDNAVWAAKMANYPAGGQPKDSLALPRRKTKKAEIKDTCERVRRPEEGKVLLGKSVITDSIRLSKTQRPSKAERKKMKQKLHEEEEDETLDSVFDGENVVEEDVGDEVTEGNNLAPLLQRTALLDSVRYNKDKMEHHGKHKLLHKSQNSFDESTTTKATSKKNRQSDPTDDGFFCQVCNHEFPTRNKLFSHIKEQGHAIVKEAHVPVIKKKGKNKKASV